jgi:predicted Zn-dependent protease
LQAGREPSRPSFFSTHSTTPERVGNVEAAARSLVRGAEAPVAATRAAFLARLEGLLIGDNPAHGVFLGSLFLHPDVDVALEMPASWKTVNGPGAAGAVAPDRDAVVVRTVVGPGDDPVVGARRRPCPRPRPSVSSVGGLGRFRRRGWLPTRVTAIEPR